MYKTKIAKSYKVQKQINLKDMSHYRSYVLHTVYISPKGFLKVVCNKQLCL